MENYVTGLCVIAFLLITDASYAQKVKATDVPAGVRANLSRKYPQAKKITWEKEEGKYEANWGEKSGEDHSVQYTPAGDFVEIANAIPVSSLPKAVFTYV